MDELDYEQRIRRLQRGLSTISALVNVASDVPVGLIEVSLEALCLWVEWQDRTRLLAGRAKGSCWIYCQLQCRRDPIKNSGFTVLPFGSWFTRTGSH